MKGTDRILFYMVILLSFLIGLFVFDESFKSYSDMITFLSIMIGFTITSLSILYNSPLRKTLYDRKIKYYKTELHRLKDFFKQALSFEVVSVIFLFVIPDKIACISFLNYDVLIGRYMIIFPILMGTTFCFYKIFSDLLKIFSHPANDKDQGCNR